uniref:Aminopeptidase puromycin sensitive n=1 Tax=Macaca nemestrina TaxID=9545 RepID=A0A2K6AMK5_MACNE
MASLSMDCSPTFCVPGLWNPFIIFHSRSSRRRRRLHSLGLAAMPEKRPFERLPADVSPINYSLCLKPDLLDFTFEGKLEAAAQVRQATNQIVMNCADIDIITASYAPEGDEEIHATGFNYQNEDEKVTLSFPSTLQTGNNSFQYFVFCLVCHFLEVVTVNILLWFDGLGDLKPSKSVSSLSYLVMSFKSTFVPTRKKCK